MLLHKQPQQHHVVAVSMGQQVHCGNSPQRHFLSENELVRQTNASNAKATSEFPYSRANNTMDNIRELAGSPQRGIYMWKDSSPGFQGGMSNSGPVVVDYSMNAVSSSNSGPVTSSIGNSSSESGGGMPSCGVHYNAMVSSSENDGSQFITVNCEAPHSHSLIMTHSRLHHQIASSANDYLQSPQQTAIVQRSNPASPTTISSSSLGAASTYLMRYSNNSTVSHQQPNTTYVQTMFNSSANNTLSGHVYQPKLHGGVAVFTPSAMSSSGNNTTQLSPQIKRKQMPTRPMSFVRALEMTDSMEMQTLDHQQQQNRNNGAIRVGQSGNLSQNLGGAPSGSRTSNHSPNNSNNNNTNNSINNNKNLTAISDRASVYDMNYEISV